MIKASSRRPCLGGAENDIIYVTFYNYAEMWPLLIRFDLNIPQVREIMPRCGNGRIKNAKIDIFRFIPTYTVDF
jgi:hypothetical protein